jgi:hypothetical protein
LISGALHIADATEFKNRFEFRHRKLATGSARTDMVKVWDDMTSEEKLESMSVRLDEIAGVVIELEKQIKGLQAQIDRQKGGTRRPVLKLG